MQRISTPCGVWYSGFCGLLAWLSRVPPRGSVRSWGSGCQCRCIVRPGPGVSPRSRRSSTRAARLCQPAPVVVDNNRSWCNHRWCMDSPTIGLRYYGAYGPGDTTIRRRRP